MCARKDSNLHTRRRCRLKTVRLPISPRAHIFVKIVEIKCLAQALPEKHWNLIFHRFQGSVYPLILPKHHSALPALLLSYC